MVNDPHKIGQLLFGLVVLSTLFAMANAAPETEPPGDARGLNEVRRLSRLPAELSKTLGWQHDDKDQIADLEHGSTSPVPKTVVRWFLLAGLSETYALVAMEERNAYSSSARLHANGFALVGARWVPSGEWVLSAQPHTVQDLTQIIESPESRALTTQWQKGKRYQDLARRQIESEPTRSFRPVGPLREMNVTDGEVRQIEAVVQSLIPGSIVYISGVARGCPCEDGPGCTAQVWTAIYRGEETYSLELSDINEHWVIGPVQRWFLELAQLDSSRSKNSAYSAARDALDDRYPACATGARGSP